MSEYDSQRPQDAGNAGETQQQPRVQVESTPAGSNIPYVQAYDTQTGKPLGGQQVVNKHTVVKTKTKKLPIFITALAGCACGVLLVIALIMSGTLNIGGGKNAVTAGASGSSTQKITIDSEDTTLAEAVSAKALPSVVSITATSSGSQNGSLSQSADESDSSGSVGSACIASSPSSAAMQILFFHEEKSLSCTYRYSLSTTNRAFLIEEMGKRPIPKHTLSTFISSPELSSKKPK